MRSPFLATIAVIVTHCSLTWNSYLLVFLGGWDVVVGVCGGSVV